MFNIKQILLYIAQLFLRNSTLDEKKLKDTDSVTSTQKKNKRLCSISFSVNNDNTMDIVCHWPDLDDLDEETVNNIATKYAVLLHAINFGIVNQDVTSTLSENLESENPSDRYFVYEVLTKMIDLAEKRERTDTVGPIVKPSNVFRYYNYSQPQ